MKLRKFVARPGCFGALLVVAGCSDSPSSPDGPELANAIALEGGSSLVFQDSGQLDPYRARVEQTVRESVAVVRTLIPVDGVTIVISSGTSLVIPEIGIGGRADDTMVRMMLNPSSPALASSLESAELFALMAHELHHVARFRTVGYGSNLLGALVSEGLADQFSIEVAGIDPPLWSTALSGETLETWSARAREEWFSDDYNHNRWFLGIGDVPRWAGYAIGFRMTSEFLEANPSRRASDLHDEPASSFVSP